MNFLGGLKSKIKGIYKTSPNENEDLYTISPSNNLDYEDIQHTLSVLQEENKILKSKVRILENSIFEDKSSTSQTNSATSTQFGKIFKELKSTILYNTDEEPRDNLHEFKRFLFDNMLFHGSIDEEDADILNNIQISDVDWEKKKEIYLFKQRVLEKNYADMFRNLLVSNQLNTYLKSKGMSMNIKEKPACDLSKKENTLETKETEDLPKFIAKSVSYETYDNNSVYKNEQNIKKEKINESSVNDLSNATANFNNFTNRSVSPIISNVIKEKPSLGIEHKLLSDLIIMENKDDRFVKNTTKIERPSVGSSNPNLNTPANEKNIQDKDKTKASPLIISQRVAVTPTPNENQKEDLSISSLLSDNNLTTSINLNDTINFVKKNQSIENINKTKPAGFIENKENKESLSISNLLSSVTKNKIITNTNTTANIISNNKNLKPENKKSLLQFDDDDDDGFTFGAILKSDNNKAETILITKSTSNNNTAIKAQDNNNIKENVNIFESKNIKINQLSHNLIELILPDKSRTNSITTKTTNVNINLKKSQWDDEDPDDIGQNYL
jgi:hypothetical protein